MKHRAIAPNVITALMDISDDIYVVLPRGARPNFKPTSIDPGATISSRESVSVLTVASAAFANIEELAGILWHQFDGLMRAVWASDDGLFNHVASELTGFGLDSPQKLVECMRRPIVNNSTGGSNSTTWRPKARRSKHLITPVCDHQADVSRGAVRQVSQA
jgi:hypothetical protein